MKDKGSEFLGNLVHYRTYAETLPNGRKETKQETIERVEKYFINRFPEISKDLEWAFSKVKEYKVVPSMRIMQFSSSVDKSNVRAYNCSFCGVDNFKIFSEMFYIAMNGAGVATSVHPIYINQLPVISEGKEDVFTIPDTREGWSDSILKLIENPKIKFNYNNIRKKGTPLSSGGTASGSQALANCHFYVREILQKAINRKLTSVELTDILCLIMDAVVVGGVRRAAMLVLFCPNDSDMLNYKSGNWWENHPHRARANISAHILLNQEDTDKHIENVLNNMYTNNTGEPGIALTNNILIGGNACFEIALQSKQFCNLTEVIVPNCRDVFELLSAMVAATIIGTCQSALTNFPYLSQEWVDNANNHPLLGVSLTGMAEAWDLVSNSVVLKSQTDILRMAHKYTSDKLGIKHAERLFTVKPSGTTSAWAGTTSGIHAAYAPYYIRRVRIDRSNPITNTLLNIEEFKPFIERDAFNKDNYVISIPIKANEQAICKGKESPIELLERMKHIKTHWINNGHIIGDNTHNVSITVEYKNEEEFNQIKQWMFDNKEVYHGISLLPASNTTYKQMPFEEITEAEYNSLINIFPTNIDWNSIDFTNIVDERLGEVACSGGSCEIR